MPKRTQVLLTAWITALLIAPAATRGAEIKVLSDSPLAPALGRIAEDFQRDGGHDVKLVFGLSPVIHKRVTDGEAGDVIIIQPNFINELVNIGKIVAGRYPTIARVGIGLFARADAAVPDIPRGDRQQVPCAVIGGLRRHAHPPSDNFVQNLGVARRGR